MTKKGTDIMRIGFQNFNGLSSQPNDPVDDSVRHWITDNDFDVFGISEMNLWWPAIPASRQFRERIREWWDPRTVRSVFTYNRQDIREHLQTYFWHCNMLLRNCDIDMSFYPRIFECFPELCHLCQNHVQVPRIQAIRMSQHSIFMS
jgi:hypothetical protein